MHAVDANLGISDVATMEQVMADSTSDRRLNMLLFALLGGLALALATIGVYGVVSYSVSQRTKELGLRMALGADRRDLLGLVVREGMMVAAMGIVLGVGVAALMGRTLSALVFGVSVWDPMSYAGVLALLALVSLVSCLVPALRASRVDPMEALRLD